VLTAAKCGLVRVAGLSAFCSEGLLPALGIERCERPEPDLGNLCREQQERAQIGQFSSNCQGLDLDWPGNIPAGGQTQERLRLDGLLQSEKSERGFKAIIADGMADAHLALPARSVVIFSRYPLIF
jgi:hypothetical protein